MALTRQAFNQKLKAHGVPESDWNFYARKYYKDMVLPTLKGKPREVKQKAFQEWGIVGAAPAPKNIAQHAADDFKENVVDNVVGGVKGVARTVVDEGPVAAVRRTTGKVADTAYDVVAKPLGLPTAAQQDKAMGLGPDRRLMPYVAPENRSMAENIGGITGQFLDPINVATPLNVFKGAGALKTILGSAATTGAVGAATSATQQALDGRSPMEQVTLETPLGNVTAPKLLLDTGLSAGVGGTLGLGSATLRALARPAAQAAPAPAPQPAAPAPAPLMLVESNPINVPPGGFKAPPPRTGIDPLVDQFGQRPPSAPTAPVARPQLVESNPVQVPPGGFKAPDPGYQPQRPPSTPIARPAFVSQQMINTLEQRIGKLETALKRTKKPESRVRLQTLIDDARSTLEAIRAKDAPEVPALPKTEAPVQNGGGGIVSRLIDDEAGFFDPAAFGRAAEDAVANYAMRQVGPIRIPEPPPASPMSDVADRLVDDAPVYDGAKHAGNLNLDRIDSTDDIKATLQRLRLERAEEPTVQSLDETRRLADASSYSLDDLLKHNGKQPLDAVSATVARDFLVSSASRVDDLAKRVAEGDNSDATRAEFLRALELHGKIDAVVAGDARAAGRALGARRIQAKEDAERVRALREMVQEAGAENIDALAAQIANRGDANPQAIARVAKEAFTPGFWDKLSEGFIMSILSAPTTHIANIAGNALTIADKLSESYVAAAMGIGRAAKGDLDRVTLREANAQAIGFAKAFFPAFSKSAEAFIKNEPVSGVTQIEGRRGAISGVKGEVIRTPGRFLLAEDEGFKHIFTQMELHALAAKEGLRRGLTGDALDAEMARLIAEPTPAMSAAAAKEADYRTFQKQLGKVAIHLSLMKRKAPILNFVVTFVKTPTNIIKYAGERTALAPFSKEVRAELAKGGAARDLALSKMMLGTGVTLWGIAHAAGGGMTGGGPSDPTERKLLMDNGWRPYSLKVGDNYIPYNRFSHHGMLLGAAADLAEGQAAMNSKQKYDAVAALIVGAMKNFGEQTFWRGISDLSKATGDPDRYFDNWVGNLGGATVPNAVARLAQSVDTTVRDTKGENTLDTIKNTIQSRVPAVGPLEGISSKQLPYRPDTLGRPIEREQAFPGESFVNPLNRGVDKHDPVLSRMKEAGVSLGALDKSIKIPGMKADLELTPDLHRALIRLRGEAVSYHVSQIPDEWWNDATPQERKEAMEWIKKEASGEARQAFWETYADEARQAYEAQLAKKKPASPAAEVNDDLRDKLLSEPGSREMKL